jgi:hypothetical protein
MVRKFWLLAVMAAVVFTPMRASATPLPPGSTVSSPPTVAPTGTIIDSINRSFSYGSGSSQVNGVVREVVVQDGSTLDFIFQVSAKKSSGANANIAMFGITGATGGFTGYTLDATQTPNGSSLSDPDFINTLIGGTKPISQVARSSDGSTIVASTNVTAGTSSYALVIKTNAIAEINNGVGGFSDGINFGVITGLLVPAAKVPEPSTLVLMGGCFTGLMAFGVWRVRRKTAVAATL